MYSIGEKIQIITHSQMLIVNQTFANAKHDALNKFDATGKGI